MPPTSPSTYQNNLWSGRTVGLLGGSFNPAHEGHRHISLMALKHLGLDAVWWLVTPQNPLKPVKGMASLETRLKTAQEEASHPQIFTTDIEKDLGTRYTADTVKKLKELYPRTRFVWLMGMDNLYQFHRWRHWQEIFKAVPVCVVDRPVEGTRMSTCPAMERFRPYLMAQEEAGVLKSRKKLPAWTILRTPMNDMSASKIRAKKK